MKRTRRRPRACRFLTAPFAGEQRYSPGEVVEAVPVRIFGGPDPTRICTSHVERQNLTMRVQISRRSYPMSSPSLEPAMKLVDGFERTFDPQCDDPFGKAKLLVRGYGLPTALLNNR
jgi:hypothetical protein